MVSQNLVYMIDGALYYVTMPFGDQLQPIRIGCLRLPVTQLRSSVILSCLFALIEDGIYDTYV
jgi:hypothetical protein